MPLPIMMRNIIPTYFNIAYTGKSPHRLFCNGTQFAILTEIFAHELGPTSAQGGSLALRRKDMVLFLLELAKDERYNVRPLTLERTAECLDGESTSDCS